MKNDLIRGIIGSFVSLLLAGVLLLALQGYKTLVPDETGKSLSNITQSDFDQAMAKWTAQNVNVYEIAVSDSRMSLRLRVDNTTGKIYMLEHKVGAETETVDGLKLALTGVADRTFRAYTIDSLYKTIHDALVGSELSTLLPGGSTGATNGPSTTYELNARFDGTRGYPTHMQISSRDTLSSREITWRSAFQNVDITDVTPIQ